MTATTASRTAYDDQHPVPAFGFVAGTLFFLLVQRMSPVLGDLLNDLAGRQALRHQILPVA